MAEAKENTASDDLDDVLSGFHCYVENPTPFDVTWWTRHFPQFAQDIREHALEVIDMNFHTQSTQPKSFIARNCACCADKPTVPPDCPSCGGVGGFSRYSISGGSLDVSPSTDASKSDELLLARIAELEAALKPFARIGGHMGRTPITRAVSVGYLGVEADGLNSHARSTATVADFRAAKDVLQRPAPAASKP